MPVVRCGYEYPGGSDTELDVDLSGVPNLLYVIAHVTPTSHKDKHASWHMTPEAALELSGVLTEYAHKALAEQLPVPA
jgi:hypothetical protein